MNRKYRYKQQQGLSDPVGITKLMEIATKRLVVGEGPFKVVKDGKDGHPHLTKKEALKEFRSEIVNASEGVEIVLRNPSKVLLSAHYTQKVVNKSYYKNPFHGDYTSARIDAGVDYCGTATVHPIGKAKILHVGTPSHTSTFGSDMAVYELLEGPAKGKRVFFAEHYNNIGNHHDGDIVDVNTPLYKMNGCIEIGWADDNGSLAWGSGLYHEGELSVIGENFSKFMVALGAKPGLALGRPVTGHLPPGYPDSWADKV